jgi:4-amino-4-deoxychorismate lyase
MWNNGSDSTQVSAFDRGLAYGDGFFTTICIHHGRPVFWERHVQRLQICAQRLQFPAYPFEDLYQVCLDEAQGAEWATVKILVTRGLGGRGYSLEGCDTPAVLVSAHLYPHHYHAWQQTGIHLGVCQQRLGYQPMLAGLKTLNRLEQVLLKAELDAQGWPEAVVLDAQDQVVEAVSANVFWRKGKRIFTPDLQRAGVCGVMRAFVMQSLATDSPVEPVVAGLNVLLQADEVWITNALMGIVPITGIQDVDYQNHDMATQLQEAFARGL